MKKGLIKGLAILVCGLSVCTSFCGCKSKKADINITLPQKIAVEESANSPTLKVYDKTTKSTKSMPLEKYLLGVVAGEMYNSWELEALKAQAVLARTYTLFFLQNYKSKYPNADISNDITEAQAYDESKINDNIKRAVQETEGIVLTVNGSLIEPWFHSNSGGVTTTAKNGLNYLDEESYTKTQKSVENESNSKNFKWSATFSKSDMLNAIREMGASVASLNSFTIGSVDDSGRVKQFKIGGATLDANSFRIKIGSTKMKSTKITNIVVSAKSVYMEGVGYGHGVGMSQWGAKILAEEGKSYEDILNFYFENIQICKAKY